MSPTGSAGQHSLERLVERLISAVRRRTARLRVRTPELDEIRRHQYPAGFPVRLALKDLPLVREVEQSSQATMPLLDAVLERFTTASEELADRDLAAINELDGPAAA